MHIDQRCRSLLRTKWLIAAGIDGAPKACVAEGKIQGFISFVRDGGEDI